MSLKTAIAGALHRVALATGYSVNRARGIKTGRIIMFHGVGDDDYPEAEFEAHLRFLKEHFSIVPLSKLAEKVKAGLPLTDEVVLTFDDGLRNNFTSAYPILKRLDLPATFFVCPALIENRQWLWNHESRARLKSLSADARARLAGVLGSPGGEVEQMVSWMKTLPLGKRHEAEEIIRKETSSFVPSASQLRSYEMMSWQELRSLDPSLITIGSHTVNHPILSNLGLQEIAYEISESRRLLEAQLGRPVEEFCYPNGAHNPAVVEEVRKHYKVAVTTEPGFVRSGMDLVQLPRLGIVRQPLLSWRLHRPSA